MAPTAISEPFSSFDLTVHTKILLLGSCAPSVEMAGRLRSLHLEHVSPSALLSREISRRPGSAGTEEDSILALLRRWFFARKPDAGFVLADFPATLLQALVFDEWLDVRDESLDAAFAAPGAFGPVVDHYRLLGRYAEAAGRAFSTAPAGQGGGGR